MDNQAPAAQPNPWSGSPDDRGVAPHTIGSVRAPRPSAVLNDDFRPLRSPVMPSPAHRGQRVLIVDDDVEFGTAASLLLVASGYEVVGQPGTARLLEVLGEDEDASLRRGKTCWSAVLAFPLQRIGAVLPRPQSEATRCWRVVAVSVPWVRAVIATPVQIEGFSELSVLGG
jgi:hypothetical protein